MDFVGGFVIVECDKLDEVIEIAAGHPYARCGGEPRLDAAEQITKLRISARAEKFARTLHERVERNQSSTVS